MENRIIVLEVAGLCSHKEGKRGRKELEKSKTEEWRKVV